MKVGTDGVLLGSWIDCRESNNILDIGCGTGLITLMLAQRNSTSNIVGIEIDKIASKEAQLNIHNSGWGNRISIEHISLQDFETNIKFDLIVSNPPFFPANDSKDRRDIARRTNSLSFELLIHQAIRFLSKTGCFYVILPKNSEYYFCEIAEKKKLFCNRICYVKGHKNAKVKRVLMQFSFSDFNTKEEDFLIIEESRNKFTDHYIQLCKEFYLGM